MGPGRNRHCPKCRTAAARQLLEDREAEFLPILSGSAIQWKGFDWAL
jgi:hypothetical protein